MKLIIDIPEDIYEALRKSSLIISGQRSGKNLTSIIFYAVANGKPQEQKTGHWKERRNRATGHIETVCSECGAEEGYPYNDYCGNCGAQMFDTQESEV